MGLKIIGWLIFGGGVIVGILITAFFASLKIKGLRDPRDLKDSRIRILQRQTEEKDAIIKGFIEKEKENE